MKRDDNENILNNLPKLKWACRRGMLELDVLLGNFLNEAYPDLSLDNKKLFIQLLECEDPEIYAWIMGHETAPEPHLILITELIRNHARSRN